MRKEIVKCGVTGVEETGHESDRSESSILCGASIMKEDKSKYNKFRVTKKAKKVTKKESAPMFEVDAAGNNC